MNNDDFGELFMGNKNTGKEYEKLAQAIFDQIINQKTVETIEVKQDVTIEGKTTTHQIDVYWEFDLGGIKYRTIIQAKDWKNKVKQEQMLAFKAIIDDFPAGTMGVFVSRSGFQSGAITVAQKHGIKMYELREPTDKDWEGTITKVNLQMTYRTPRFEKLELIVDKEWLYEKYNGEFHDSGVFSGQDMLLKEDGTELCTLANVIEKVLSSATDEMAFMEYTFDENTFLIMNGKKVKVNGLKGNFGYYVSKDTIKIDAENIVGMILKDLSSGEIKRFDKQNKLLGK